ncbi:UDP-N-acetylmuramoyl-tripeptide--D-alanyl-D-alanine ligase [Alienimonas californiensis]|uniref:UDP-N-acetylmuramoyl-tripeptide--D-alanyl-D-alanine ligase n=1 Tax=Alienimonas californiensis TaxID=2527989 RepID=A0A517P9L7_9PLAN|nr:UDP-N-acetylmuramoyl-tripeptide--D-alanyl-D-alanine ligase [Alienimonas californiensis]QDT16073.1 UDP-N-acetylmuramoyl-tripeptide--D-alanyl-D-alanine ligase MurF [Alienimonas californiensis]
MFPLTLKQLPDLLGNAEAPQGLCVMGDVLITGAAIDSRAVRPGDLFFALPGERTDGHAHVAAALERGAVAAVVAREVSVGPAFVVPDPAAALARLGAWNRRRFAGPVVAVGGSHGKTTTRELIAATLHALGPGVRSRANFNNALGVPLTLCELGPSHRWAVVELGASRPSDLTELGGWARPTVAVLTGVGTAHVGTFGGPAALRAAKAELFATLQADGSAVVNGDDPGARSLAAEAGRPVLFAGTGPGCDVRLEPLPAPPGFLRFQRGETSFRLPGFAPHLVSLAACAVAAGEALGLTPESIRDGFAGFQPPPGRGTVTTVGGVTLIDDTYNAPPEGFFAAVDLLARWPVEPPGRRWLVCGGMKELGEEADRLHAELGRRIAAAGLDRAVFVGETGACVAIAAGLLPPIGLQFATAGAAAEAVLNEVRAGDVVLAKGCRSDRLERVVAALAERLERGRA